MRCIVILGDKMKNKILLSLLLLLTLLIITGCKNNLISKETKNEKSELPESATQATPP